MILFERTFLAIYMKQSLIFLICYKLLQKFLIQSLPIDFEIFSKFTSTPYSDALPHRAFIQ